MFQDFELCLDFGFPGKAAHSGELSKGLLFPGLRSSAGWLD